jgi:hypothetical protein
MTTLINWKLIVGRPENSVVCNFINRFRLNLSFRAVESLLLVSSFSFQFYSFSKYFSYGKVRSSTFPVVMIFPCWLFYSVPLKKKKDGWIEKWVDFFTQTENDADENQFSTVKKLKKTTKKTQHTMLMCVVLGWCEMNGWMDRWKDDIDHLKMQRGAKKRKWKIFTDENKVFSISYWLIDVLVSR